MLKFRNIPCVLLLIFLDSISKMTKTAHFDHFFHILKKIIDFLSEIFINNVTLWEHLFYVKISENSIRTENGFFCSRFHQFRPSTLAPPTEKSIIIFAKIFLPKC